MFAGCYWIIEMPTRRRCRKSICFPRKGNNIQLFVDIDSEESERMWGLRRKSPSTPFVRVPHPGCIMHRWLESDFDQWEKDYRVRIIYMPLAFRPSTAEWRRMKDRVILVNTETKCDIHVGSSGLQKNNVTGAHGVERNSNDYVHFSASPLNRSSFVRSFSQQMKTYILCLPMPKLGHPARDEVPALHMFTLLEEYV